MAFLGSAWEVPKRLSKNVTGVPPLKMYPKGHKLRLLEPPPPPLENHSFASFALWRQKSFFFGKKKGCTPNYFFQKIGGNP